MSGCCGMPSGRRRKVVETPLPANPRLSGGVPALYLGVGNQVIVGAESGLTYHVGGSQRVFRVHPGDLDTLLLRKDIVLLP